VDEMSDPLKPERLGVISCGVAPSENGNLLTIVSVLEAIDYIFDDDSKVSIRMSEFLDHLL